MNLRVVFLSKAVTVIETFKSMVCRFAAYLLFMDIQNNSVCVSGGGEGEGRAAGVGSEGCRYSERLSQKVKKKTKKKQHFLPSMKGQYNCGSRIRG